MRSWIRSGALLALFGSACLGDPELRDCIDFPLGETGCPAACELYCAEAIARCTGDDALFPTEGACLNDCANEPVDPNIVEGAFGDESGNSLSCRLTYLRRGECAEAALQGSTQCVGASCEDYCDIMVANCDGAYANEENCLASCATLPRAVDDSDQNSVECRFKYALQVASSQDVALCNPASYAGGGRCGTACETYCNLLELHCTDGFAPYPDRPTCEEVCGRMNFDGQYNDWTSDEDSVQCRVWHAGPPSQQDPGTHCKHTRVYNDEVCGNDGFPCSTFCDVMLRTCPGVYPDLDTCLTECPDRPEFQNIPPEGPAAYPVSTRDCPTR